MKSMLRASAAVLALSVFSAPALAQDAAEDTDAQAPGEIVVTAQKRSESLQNVPISIQALGTKKLDELGH